MKRRIIGAILLLGPASALGAALIQAMMLPHLSSTAFVCLFWGVLIGYCCLAVPLVFPAARGRKRDYLQTLLFPLAGELCLIAVVFANRDKQVSGLEGLGPAIVVIELAVITPVLMLAVTSFCTIFKNLKLRIGLPVLALAGHITFSCFPLSADYHESSKWVDLILIELVPIAALVLYMIGSLLLWLSADRQPGGPE